MNKTALKIAQDFNREVLKGQLSPDGKVVLELAKRIEEALEGAWDDGRLAETERIYS